MRLEPGLHVALPEPPADLIQVRPVTSLVSVQHVAAGCVATSRHVISQTSHRVHVSQSNGQEWLFERHDVDGRRVSGFLSHHDSRTIVVHESCDLFCWFDIRGWLDVIAFAGHRGALGRLIAGSASGLGRVTVEVMRTAVDPRLLEPPYLRFPDYRLMDLGEWFTG